ncbi:MAG: response regulator [Desulfomonile tiedjei]|nr:response regulator [Desulfomonile tiedjei]
MTKGKSEILVVEDSPTQAALLKHLLRGRGHEVTVANSGKEALLALARKKPDLIISDVIMPEMDGFELALATRQDRNLCDVPIMLLTALTDTQDIIRGLEAGVDYYLTKPYDNDYLLARVQAILSDSLAQPGVQEELEFVVKADREPHTIRSTPQRLVNLLLCTYENSVQINRSLIKAQEELSILNQQLEAKVRERTANLQREIEQRTRAERDLLKAHDELERRVQERTAELASANTQLRNEMRQREAAEEAIRRSERKFRLLVDNSPIGIIYADRQGNILGVNRRLVEIFGAPSAEDAESLNLLSSPALVTSGISDLLNEAMEHDRGVRAEFPYKSIWGKEVYCRIVVTPMRTTDGEVYGSQAVVEDISDTKKAERIMLESQRANALAELGGLVAHNFNNVLQVVIGGAQLALTNLELGNLDDIRNSLQQILQSAFGGAETVKRLQYLVRVQPEEESLDKVFDLSLTVHRAIEMSRLWWQTNPEKFGIKVLVDRYLGEGCFVRGSSNELFEVVVNLIRNATEALPNGGRITVKTFAKDGKSILQVADDGVGIPEQDLGKVFDPFWTTKGLPGSGIGLYSSRMIIAKNGGDISVESREGAGSTVTVTLPLCARPEEKPEAARGDEPRSKLNILLIDDMKPVLTMLQEGLELHGHKVYSALSGNKALEIFKQRQIDIVICDLGMPEMNGWQVGQAIKGYCAENGKPKSPFILITGWSGQQNAKDRIAESGVDAVVEKPVELSRLLDLAGKILAERLRETGAE